MIRIAPAGWIVGVIVLGLAILVLFMFREVPSGPPEFDDRPQGHFRDMAAEAGLHFLMAYLPDEQGENFKVNLYDHGCGVAVADFDGDGYEDIYFLNQLGPNALYKNNRDGTFTDVGLKAGVALGDRICVGATFADYDNDGHPDLYVTSVRGGNVLFHNMGNGTFKDVTKEAGLTWIGHSQTATFFDFDNDGLLDLFLTNTAKWTQQELAPGGRYFPGVENFWGLAASPREFNVLYRNNGNGTFTNVTDKAGISGQGWGGDIAAFDYDEDGCLDVFVTNMFGRSQLYRNNRDGTFSDVTGRVLGRTSFGAIGCKVFDFNNDGKLDLLIVDMHSDMWTSYHDLDRDAIKMEEKTKFPYLSGPMKLARYEGQGEIVKFSPAWLRRPAFLRENLHLGRRLCACGRCCLCADAA
ncbi:MAG: VCBS repeat-containing protein [Planctomycetes bacterium]|nr:VCBS repeat-containing protein [Planctomycetota bacterium]